MSNRTKTFKLQEPDLFARYAVLVLLLVLASCVEEVNSPAQRTGPVTLQLHNFNSSNGKPTMGTAPYIHYFAQAQDGSYSFTLSFDPRFSETPFETNWEEEYLFVRMSSQGVITSSYPKRFLQNGGFESISYNYIGANQEMPNKYEVIDGRLIYFNWNADNFYEQTVLSLNPESGVAKSFAQSLGSVDIYCTDCVRPYLVHPLPDGNIISIIESGVDMYYLLNNENGDVIFTQRIIYSENYYFDSEYRYFSYFVTEKNGEYYFLNILDDSARKYWYGIKTEMSDSYFYALSEFAELSSQAPRPDFNIEVRMGGDNMQKAYRYTESNSGNISDYIYRDFNEVSFEVWDVTNNKQLAVAYSDRDLNFEFSNGDYLLISNLEYSESVETYPSMTERGGISGSLTHVIESYWTGTPGVVSVEANYIPRGLIKLNGASVEEVNPNLLQGKDVFHNIYDILPYNNGFAVLCNASKYTNGDYLSAQLLLLNNNFEKYDSLQLSEGSTSQEKFIGDGNTLLYAGIKNTSSLVLTTIRNGAPFTRELTDLGYAVESFKTLRTINGGWAVLAWVWQTPSTRDLLFIEVDENLNLVGSE